MKHQLDATLCRFNFCRVTVHVSGASAHHQEYFKLVQRPLVHVLSLQVSHHISLLGPIPVHVSNTMCSSSRGRNCQMNHQIDATLCRFYFCRVTLHVSGASAHHQEYLKTSTVATGTCVIVAGKSSHLLIRAEIRRCDDLPSRASPSTRCN